MGEKVCLLSSLSFCTTRCKTEKVDPAGRRVLLRPMLWHRVMLLLHVCKGLVAPFLPQSKFTTKQDGKKDFYNSSKSSPTTWRLCTTGKH